jgi:type VI secretion system secreted protein VgrG
MTTGPDLRYKRAEVIIDSAGGPAHLRTPAEITGMQMSGSSGNINLLSITTPLPAGSFDIVALTGTERISRPYEFIATLGSAASGVNPNRLLDQSVTVSLGDPAGKGRYITGVVAAVRQTPTANDLWQYELKIVPKLYFLGQTHFTRYYYNKTAPEIIELIFGEFNIAFSNKLNNAYATRGYTVQHNESYLNFLQRLMEDESIYYFFSHADGDHTIILADNNVTFGNINNPSLDLADQGQMWAGISSLHREDATAIGVTTYDDYNPATTSYTPGSPAMSGAETTTLGAANAADRYARRWPAVRDTAADATTKAKLRQQAADTGAQAYHGTGGSPDFVAGGKFSVTNDPHGNGSYVIKSVSYAVTGGAMGTSAGYGGGGGQGTLGMNFSAFPAANAYGDDGDSAVAPVLAGVYTAYVIGGSGEEINTDDQGRIQISFPTDYKNEIGAGQTFWARVMTPWAGLAWGLQFTPRVGMEVVVAFQEGDPHHPIVIGAVYNSVNPPSWAASDKNKSGIRTHSTTGGGSANFNEFSFDDTMGSERIYLHAEKDYLLETEHDQTVTVSNCRYITVTNDETVQINGKQTITVKGDQAITVTTGNHATEIQTGNHTEAIGQGNHELTVSQGNQKITVSQGNQTITIDQGNQQTDVTAGTVTTTAGQSITLKVGGNSLVINASGITMTVGGSTVGLTASSISVESPSVSVSGDASLSVSAPSTSVAGQISLSLTGAAVSIG